MSSCIAQWLYKNGMRRWRMHICLVMISEFQMACSYNPRYMWLLVQLLNRRPPPQTKGNYVHLCSRTQGGTVRLSGRGVFLSRLSFTEASEGTDHNDTCWAEGFGGTKGKVLITTLSSHIKHIQKSLRDLSLKQAGFCCWHLGNTFNSDGQS